MPDELSQLIQDFARPAYRHPSKEHKLMTLILRNEMCVLMWSIEDHREEMEEEGIEDGWNTPQHLLSALGWEDFGNPEERPYADPMRRKDALNWANEQYGEPFKQY